MPWQVYNSAGQLLQATDLPDNAVTNAKVANNAIDSAELVAGSVDNAHLADDAVNSDELAAGAVDIAHLSASGSAGSGTFLRGDNQWAAAGGGKIGQVVQTVKTNTWTSNSDTFDSGSDITGLTVNITPTATNSKILVMFALSGSQGYNQNRAQYRLVRGSTPIFIGVPEGSNRIAATGGIASAHSSILASTSGGVYLDSPSTTSQVTYKVQMKQQDGAASSTYVYINRSSTTWNDDVSTVVSASSIVVMEVLA